AVPVWGKSHAEAYSFRKGVAWNEGGEEDLRLTLPKPVLNIVIARKQKRGAGSGEENERNSRIHQNWYAEDKTDFNRKRRTWESLSPEKKEMLRQRMRRLKKLPPEERSRYRQRFQQWQKLSPEEREKIREDLERWNNLPPEEKEKTRLRFR
ncbi:MAG: DUF3106 domain-containing protein, partial [Desulfobacteraceae bacterium]